MRCLTWIGVMVLIFSTASAQRVLPDFGKPDLAELRLKSCTFEPGASAMVLFDTRDVEYEVGPFGDRVQTSRRVRIKIFDEKGYPAATIRIPYYSKRKQSGIKDLKGVIYSIDANGNPVTQMLDEKDFYIEKLRERIGVIRFTFPNVKPGNVLEYSFSASEKNRSQIEPWVIQRDIPVAYSSATIVCPEFSHIRSAVFGKDSVKMTGEEFRKGGLRHKRIFEKENIISFKPEPYMSSLDDNLLRVGFLVIPRSSLGLQNSGPVDFTWSMGGALLMRAPFFGGQIQKPVYESRFIIDSAYRRTNRKERLKYIFEAVRNHFTEQVGQSVFPGDLTEAWISKSGNSAEINLILLTLLKEADFQAYPILVNTRENGKVNKSLPTLAQLNGVDVLVEEDDQMFLLDASLKFQPYDAPPLNVLNRECYLLDTRRMTWLTITDDRYLLKTNTNVFAGLNPEGKLEGVATIVYYDYAKSVRLDSSLIEDESTNEKSNKPQGVQIHSTTIENADRGSDPLSERIDFTFEPSQSGDFTFIKPGFLFPDNKNPFTQSSRNSDIDLICNQQHQFTLNLTLPDDWEPETLPKNAVIRSPDSSFYFYRSTTYSGSNLFYTYTYEINRALFEKDEYEGIKEVFRVIYTQMNEEIILKRRKK